MAVRGSEIPFKGEVRPDVKERVFRDRGDQRYSLELLPAGITLEVDRLRRSSHELWGELQVTVAPSLALARTIDGILSIGDLNFSSVTARGTRAKVLAERSRLDSLDWFGFVEELCIKTIAAERLGTPDVSLRDVPRPEAARVFEVDGVELPLHHPMILFGDGGTAKSYLALYWAGKMMQMGKRVLYADWEFTPEEHRERLEFLFGADFPGVRYLSCYHSIREERERLSKAIARSGINYLICDSVGVACGADPSGSDAATSYFQALRQLGNIGSLHIAHITKGEHSDQKPFGSAFWHNMARVTMNVKSEDIDKDTVALALYPRKRNLKGRAYPVAFQVAFGTTTTVITSTDVKNHAVLAEGLPIAERLQDALKRGSKTRKELADILGVSYELLQRTVYREVKKGTLVEIEGSRGSARLSLRAAADF